MALRLSTGFRNKWLDGRATPIITLASTISFSDGGGSNDSILDSGNGLGDHVVGDNFVVAGTVSNDGSYPILVVEADGSEIQVATGSLTNESAGTLFACVSAIGACMADAFRNGVISIHIGSQPATADDAESGTKILEITIGSGAFVADAPGNGLNLGQVVAGILGKEIDPDTLVDEIWSGIGINGGGTAGWWRMYDNSFITGASTVEVRMDGTCATSGGQINMASTNVVNGATTTVDSVAITLPASA